MRCPPVAPSRPGDAGAASLERVGAVLIAAVLVGAVAAAVTAANPGVTRAAYCAVRSLVDQSGDCAGGTSAGPGGPGTVPADSPAAPGYANAAPRPAETVDPLKVENALEDIRDDLDGGWNGVRSGELEDIQEIFEWLNGAELDAVIAELSDDELRHLIDQLDDGSLFGGWSRERRQEFWTVIASKASPRTMARLARLTDEVQPGFSDVGGDGARDDPSSPANTAGYTELPHQLFVTGPGDDDPIDPRDPAQGQIGDCWVIAGMMATAQADPALIRDAIRANPNGTYTVTLYHDGRPIEITVTPDLPSDGGAPVFVGNAGDPDTGDDSYELWPMVLEKAVAQYTGSYGEVEGGRGGDALTLLTGSPTRFVTDRDDVPSLTQIETLLDGGGAMTLSSLDRDDQTPFYTRPTSQGGLAPTHAYYVSEVDPDAGTVTVVNPWGTVPDTVLTYQEFLENFDRWDINELEQGD